MIKKNKSVQKSSLTKRSIQKFMKNKMACIGLVVASIIILACVFAPLLTPHDPAKIDPSIRNLDPCWDHPLGTDRIGRDVFARLLYGGRVSIFIGISAALISGIIGSSLGAIAGYFGGKADTIIMAFTEIVGVFPSTLLILLLTGVFERSIFTTLGVMALFGWVGFVRMIRSRMFSLREEPFVESCRANGISNRSIIFHHIVPNNIGIFILQITNSISGCILQEASLSYLGFGVPMDVPTWGNILNAARNLETIQSYPLLWIAPGLTICALCLSLSFVGDGLRDALDPTTR